MGIESKSISNALQGNTVSTRENTGIKTKSSNPESVIVSRVGEYTGQRKGISVTSKGALDKYSTEQFVRHEPLGSAYIAANAYSNPFAQRRDVRGQASGSDVGKPEGQQLSLMELIGNNEKEDISLTKYQEQIKALVDKGKACDKERLKGKNLSEKQFSEGSSTVLLLVHSREEKTVDITKLSDILKQESEGVKLCVISTQGKDSLNRLACIAAYGEELIKLEAQKNPEELKNPDDQKRLKNILENVDLGEEKTLVHGTDEFYMILGTPEGEKIGMAVPNEYAIDAIHIAPYRDRSQKLENAIQEVTQNTPECRIGLPLEQHHYDIIFDISPRSEVKESTDATAARSEFEEKDVIVAKSEIKGNKGQENPYYAAAKDAIGDHIQPNDPKQLAFLKKWEQKVVEQRGIPCSEDEKRNMFIATIGKSYQSMVSIDTQHMVPELRLPFAAALDQMGKESKITKQSQEEVSPEK